MAFTIWNMTFTMAVTLWRFMVAMVDATGNIHDCKHNCCIGATNHRDRVIDIVTRSHHDGITCVKG
ncbi:hypothetical protein JHK85_006850 [Glycine max]|uniref:Secreted protein n=2 Tax=Glycine subgen. Soja TaxID=1462606 RepID=A0A0R0K740_SOYBN|nr:hypothetical protein JHK85_006850 [Glycine max]KAH1068951.1 hypothetical protein GYH30_006503 [Glycine max]RZC19539.1 hypothetical protein D0Y65_006389 [Glycine soja]